MDYFNTVFSSMHGDLEILFDDVRKVYCISIETALGFDTEDGAKLYVEECLKQVESWMNKNGHDTTYEPGLWEVFTNNKGINAEYDSPEKMFGMFRVFVRGFNGVADFVSE